jgi:hypothetical protein
LEKEGRNYNNLTLGYDDSSDEDWTTRQLILKFNLTRDWRTSNECLSQFF